MIQPKLLDVPIASLTTVSMAEANGYLSTWQHRLGPVHRPFTQVAYALTGHRGEVLALAVSGSAVTDTVAGYQRVEVVELTRLVTRPDSAHLSRVMLRLWRELCAPLWPDWKPRAAISYSHNAMHRGDLYRFDGWQKVTDKAGVNRHGQTGWSREKYGSQDVRLGFKTLWLWRYE